MEAMLADGIAITVGDIFKMVSKETIHMAYWYHKIADVQYYLHCQPNKREWLYENASNCSE